MSPIRLLIADDSVEFRKSVRAMLAFEKDVEVVAVARDGQEAVEMARHFQPDIAVMDVNMPRLDGLSAIRAIAQFSPLTVCMVMSSEGERDMLRQAMAAGVREYLIKPFTPEEMVAAVQRMGAQVAEVKQKAEVVRAAEVEREKYLVQLTLAYLKIGRMDDEASKVYAVMISRPQVDPNLLIRLADVFLARRDWRLLRMVCERMEKRSGPLSK